MEDIVKKVEQNIKKEFSGRETEAYTIDKYSDPVSLLENHAAKNYDVYFLDIEMPGTNGDEVARKIRESNEKAEIIFVSDYDEYAYNVFDIKPIAFVRKTKMDTDFPRAINNLLEAFRKKSQIIEVKTKDGKKYIGIDKLICLEVLGHKLLFRYDNGNEAGEIAVRDSLASYEELMLKNDFIKTHKAFLVNYRYITGFVGGDVLMKYGLKAPISRRRRDEVEKKMIEKIRRKGL